MTTNYISGLSSGLDWTSMISQLMEVERQPEQLLEKNKTTLNTKYTAWKEVNTKLTSLKTATEALTTLDDFDLFTSSSSITGSTGDVSDFVTFAVGSNASQGSYTLKIDNLAQAQKLGSKSFDSTTEEMGLTGDLVINGRTVSIKATDSLSDIRTKINKLNSGSNPAGVVASISTVGTGEYRLTLTSSSTGTSGIAIANGSANDVLGSLGFADSTTSIRKSITGGAQSSRFSDTSSTVENLLGLASPASASVQIGGYAVTIDLSQSLQDIRDNINTTLNGTGITASIVSEKENDTTYYRLQIDGSQTFTDSDHVLETLGFLKRGISDVTGLTSSTANTADGQNITGDSLLTSIDGYNTYTAGDRIHITGTRNGSEGVDTYFTVSSTSTVQDLLDAVKTAFNNEVNTYVDANGKLVMEDNIGGASSLALTLTAELGSGTSTLSFGTFSAPAGGIRKRQLVAGEDAQITLDGATITRSKNQISDVIQGVTLNLVKEDDEAEVTLNIEKDTATIKKNIQSFVTAYNAINDYVNDQFKYTTSTDSSTGKTTTNTPALFGDSSLLSIRGSLRDSVLSVVSGLDSSLNRLGSFGITIDKTGDLSIDDEKLDGYLKTNLDDLINLFSVQGSSTNSALTYVGSTSETEAGSYEVRIDNAAVKGSITGTGFDGSLDADTTITLADNSGRTATVSLQAGWNMDNIVEAINTELAKEYKQTLVGANMYYADDHQGSAITETTKLQDIYNASGANAGLAASDTIHFSGMDRDGVMIDSTFTITDPSTQTVGDFLDYIEAQFGEGYDASIDSSGRIVIQDTTAGTSSLALTIDAGKLDFGSIDVDPTGADGSSSGRYAVSVVVENDGGNLKISNPDYGSEHFDVSITGADLGIESNRYSGEDVAGAIRKVGSSTWMTMTGSGTSLKVDDDQDAAGLEINYTGTVEGDTFDFNFTTGIGEKTSRVLKSMIDTGGYINDKEKSLQNQMDKIDEKIDNMEIHLTKRQEQLLAQYTAMETMLAKLQAQQQQLESQINGLSS